MVWRKRRRYRLANIVSYLCAFFGIVFIAGNVIMLREGFAQLYSTAFRERKQLSHDQVGNYRSVDRVTFEEWSEIQHFPAFDIPTFELPSSALEADLRLRKLMENDSTLGLLPKNASDAPKRLLRKIIMNREETVVPQRRPAHPNRNIVVQVSSRDLRRSLNVSSDCDGLQNKTEMDIVGFGWTKVVYKTRYRKQHAALKMVDTSGHDVFGCLEKNKKWTYAQCYEQATQKLLKEIVLLRGLRHPHIITVFGHCVPQVPDSRNHDSLVSMATELGESVDIIKLLHMSWEDRLRISYGLSKLLFYLAHSPFGSVVLNDFRRQQFVLIKGDLKLTDLDDMGFRETQCLLDADCEQYFSSANLTLRAKCISNQCLGLNEKKNIFNAARHFTTFLLPHGAPRTLRPVVDQLVDHFSNATKTSHQLLQDMTVIVDAYSSGSYLNKLNRDRTNYRRLSESDLPGVHDYRCKYTMQSTGCTVSVFDQKEAEAICDQDVQCQCFVLTETRTWTGRMLAHFKKGLGPLTRNSNTNVFIKPSVIGT